MPIVSWALAVRKMILNLETGAGSAPAYNRAFKRSTSHDQRQMPMSEWDAFISHASEDKDEVAVPLAAALERAGLLVWLDRQEIRVGDSLGDKVDDGLTHSAVAIVIVSPSFLASAWAQSELKAFVAMEETLHRTIIYPVWHRVDKATVVRRVPRLADRIAANTDEGIATVAVKILEVVLRPDSNAPSATRPTRLRLLNRLLERDASRDAMVAFFSAHRSLIHDAVGSSAEFCEAGVQLGAVTVDLCVVKQMYTAGEMHWFLLQFQPPLAPLLLGSSPAPDVAARVREIKEARRWIAANLDRAQEVLPDIQVGCNGIVVAGRRGSLSAAERDALREYNEELTGIRVRTYDWIIDAQTRKAS